LRLRAAPRLWGFEMGSVSSKTTVTGLPWRLYSGGGLSSDPRHGRLHNKNTFDHNEIAEFSKFSKRYIGLLKMVEMRRKLVYLHQARMLSDLLAPPGNRLEALKGNRAGQHSIRINDQWRICFVWRGGDAERVEIVDYH
jgi:proteic killer suppression protein